ncbi:restriction endonuclease type II-like protein [Tribonema minus]|uniref:Restriction endonuclease type II-like protein n=1 Tax=Tribonema minus TaxID=303371 RepID=A0A836CHN3_9STRA|nr:restriction endonuclease type II-like protein [Tribonema minus]
MEAEGHGSVDDDGDDGGGGGGSSSVAGVTVESLSGAHAIVCTYARAAERLSLLDELRPRWVLMYDPDVAFVRELELHAATRGAAAAGAAAPPPPPLTVHFAVYRDSAEHQRFLTALRREAKAFETLIEEKGRMVVSVAVTDAPGAAAAPVPLSLDTRTGPQRRRARAGPPTAVVDVREFRSALPSLLHARGFRLAPLTIAVGDYVLSPELCVERKSVADLFSSFASGRLWNQADAMARWYRKPVLLIEFSAERAFGLQGGGELSSDIKVDAICSKMALLTMHFPQLRVLWSRSPHATVAIFEALMRNEAPVDAAAALAAGARAGAADSNSAARRCLLLRLPGVTASNFRALMRAGGSVAGVAALSLPQLTAAMGRVGARQLYNFVREQPNL